MKKFKLIRNIALPIMAIGAGTIVPLATTSCGDNAMPTAPNDFYTETTSINTFVQKMMSPWNDDWSVKGNFNWATDMANSSRYTNNMIKWDIIYQLCYTMAGRGHVTFHFNSFARQGIQVKYQIVMTSATSTNLQITYETSPDDTSSPEPVFTDMVAPETWDSKTMKIYSIQTDWKAKTGYPTLYDYGNYARSYFLTDTTQG